MWLIYPRHCTPISIKIRQHLLKTKIFRCVFHAPQCISRSQSYTICFHRCTLCSISHASSAVQLCKISNRIVTSVFDSERVHFFEYLPSPGSYLFNRMTPIFQLSSEQNLQTWSRLLAHYGPPSTETPTTETTTVRCRKVG